MNINVNRLYEEADKIPVSFLKYCEYTAKSHDFIELMLNKIHNTYKDESKEELVNWIVSEKRLSLGNIMYYLCETFGYDGGEILE